MTADEAATISSSTNLQTVFEKIREKATQGLYSIQLNEKDLNEHRIKITAFKHLEGLGYKITEVEQETFGETFKTWEISWAASN